MGNQTAQEPNPPREAQLPLMIEILHDLYIDLIYQKYRNSGSIVHMYIDRIMQDFYHHCWVWGPLDLT